MPRKATKIPADIARARNDLNSAVRKLSAFFRKHKCFDRADALEEARDGALRTFDSLRTIIDSPSYMKED